MAELIERLRDEADLYANEGAEDIALLLNEAADALSKATPDWKGYALLGDPARTGGYVMEHSAAPPDPELGAEFIIRPATEKDRDGGRQVGETRPTDGGPIQPETMAIRIGFLNVAALDALEAQLRVLREENFPAPVSGVAPVEAPRYAVRWSNSGYVVYTPDGRTLTPEEVERALGVDLPDGVKR
jgi:hypothetical protein